MRNKTFITGIILLSLTLVINGQGTGLKKGKQVLKAEIDSILQSQVNRDKIPGAVVLIKRNNKVIYR
ncbi:MAG: hypothetical protein MUP53_09075, partial [Bacteroidales bacterium]|nr:hypothetical protein [Bacteroidales bacterium]